MDRRGIEIEQSGKHKITYIDEVEKKPLIEINYVESYKKYNVQSELPASDPPCCIIF